MFTFAAMIKSFAGRETAKVFNREHARRILHDIQTRALMRLMQIDAATRIEDLRLPPSNHLESLKHDRKGQWSVRINDQWRICFRFDASDAFDVEIVDYH